MQLPVEIAIFLEQLCLSYVTLYKRSDSSGLLNSISYYIAKLNFLVSESYSTIN
jgi:hypothetical protein